MAIETPPPIDPVPLPAPQRGDRGTFSNRVDAFITWLTAAVLQFANLATNVYNNAVLAMGFATTASDAATVASQARTDAALARTDAVAAASSAAGSASAAATSAAAAQASADSASAVTGLPAISPAVANYKMVVNSAGTAYTLAVDGSALGFVPVQQGGGAGQGTTKVYIGSDGTDLKAQVGTTDKGYVLFSSTKPSTSITFSANVAAPRFTGAHYGDGANITGLTAAQINGALGYVAQAAAAPGGSTEIGKYLDFHSVNSVNDYDARISADAPSAGNGTSTLRVTASQFAVQGTVVADYFSGDGRYLTLQYGQLISALGFTPAPNTSPVITSVATSFGSGSDGAIRLVQPNGGSFSVHIELIRVGQYALKMGLDGDNAWKLGGSSQGDNLYRLTVDTSGNVIASGNVTAASDIRFKNEIRRLTKVCDKIMALPHGGFTYLDNRTNRRKIGNAAGDFLLHFPEAVESNADGLSLAYGQAALALLVEVVHELKAEINGLKAEINELKGK